MRAAATMRVEIKNEHRAGACVKANCGEQQAGALPTWAQRNVKQGQAQAGPICVID